MIITQTNFVPTGLEEINEYYTTIKVNKHLFWRAIIDFYLSTYGKYYIPDYTEFDDPHYFMENRYYQLAWLYFTKEIGLNMNNRLLSNRAINEDIRDYETDLEEFLEEFIAIDLPKWLDYLEATLMRFILDIAYEKKVKINKSHLWLKQYQRKGRETYLIRIGIGQIY